MLTEERKAERRAATELVEKLTAQVREGARAMGPEQARYIVDLYYELQRVRIGRGNQTYAHGESDERADVQQWVRDQMEALELRLKALLDMYTDGTELGRRVKGVCGIGPVLAAGLAAHVKPEMIPTAGALWRFAGLDPSQRWLGRKAGGELVWKLVESGMAFTDVLATVGRTIGMRPETLLRFASTGKDGTPQPITVASMCAAAARRPWNARLKVLCWKIGESFIKQSGRPEAEYGMLFARRKAREVERNDSGDNVGAAAAMLAARDYKSDTEARAWLTGCYPAGLTGRLLGLDVKARAKLLKQERREAGQGQKMLPPGQVHARARRWVVKMFLADYQRSAVFLELGQVAPKAYALSNPDIAGEHVHEWRGSWVPEGA